MILLFQQMGVKVLFGLSDARLLSIAAPFSKYIFMPVAKLRMLKAFSVEEEAALDDTMKILSECEDLSEAKLYIIKELGKVGFSYVQELSTEDYLNRFENDGFR